MCSVTSSPKIVSVWDNVEKYCRAGQATHDNTAHALCMLSNKGHRKTLRICNTYCFFTATVVSRTLCSVALYVQCLPCLLPLPASRVIRVYILAPDSQQYTRKSAYSLSAYGAHETAIWRNWHNSLNWDSGHIRQLGYKHTFRQNVMSTKKKNPCSYIFVKT